MLKSTCNVLLLQWRKPNYLTQKCQGNLISNVILKFTLKNEILQLLQEIFALPIQQTQNSVSSSRKSLPISSWIRP